MIFKKIIAILLILQVQQLVFCWEDSLTEVGSFSSNVTYVVSNRDLGYFYSEPKILEDNVVLLTHVKCRRGTYKCQAVEEKYEGKPCSECEINGSPENYVTNKKLEERECFFELPKHVKVGGVNVIRLNENVIVIDWFLSAKKSHSIPSSKLKSLYTRRVQIMRMSNCWTFEIENIPITSLNEMPGLIVPRENGLFDVFYEDFTSCKGGRSRKTFDAKGLMIAEPICIMDPVPRGKYGTDVVPISNNEYFLLERYHDHWSGSIVLYDNSDFKEVLRGHRNRFGSARISTSHGRVTVCWLLEKAFYTNVTCSIIDLQSHRKDKLTFSFPHGIDFFEIRNLPDNEYLIFTSPHIPNYYQQKAIEEKTYNLWKFRGDGTHSGKSVRFDGLSLRSPFFSSRASIVERNDYVLGQEVCILFSYNAVDYQPSSLQRELNFAFKTHCWQLSTEENNVFGLNL